MNLLGEIEWSEYTYITTCLVVPIEHETLVVPPKPQ